jgi:hypothetical protein
MVKFDDVLTVDEKLGKVFASGPFDPSKERVVDLCAWVFQGDVDMAAATEMTHDGAALVEPEDGDGNGDGDGHHHLHVEGSKWHLRLGTIGDKSVREGDAFAVAVALLERKDTDNQQVVWWGHPVTLKAV